MSLVLNAVWSKITNKPFDLDFAITTNCNYHCKMCSQWKNNVDNELSLLEIEKIFSSYGGFKVIGVTGGEPFLRDDIDEIIKIIVESQPKLKILFITTNGSLPQKISKKILNIAKVDKEISILVSLDGPKKIHNMIRGNPKAYEHAIKTLEELTEVKNSFSNLHLGILTSYSPFNYKRYDSVLDEIEKISNSFNLDSQICICFAGNLFQNLGEKWPKNYLNSLSKYVSYITKIVSNNHSFLSFGRRMFFAFSQNYLQSNTKQVIPCLSGKIRYYLTSKGEVYPCVIYNEKMGDLRRNGYDFKQVFNSIKAKEIRQKIKNKECYNCYVTCELIPSLMAQPFRALWELL